MLTRTLLSFTLLLTLAPLGHAQTAAKTPAPEQAAPEQTATDALAERRAALLADLRALEAESKELLKPLDAASARVEIGAAVAARWMSSEASSTRPSPAASIASAVSRCASSTRPSSRASVSPSSRAKAWSRAATA